MSFAQVWRLVSGLDGSRALKRFSQPPSLYIRDLVCNSINQDFESISIILES